MNQPESLRDEILRLSGTEPSEASPKQPAKKSRKPSNLSTKKGHDSISEQVQSSGQALSDLDEAEAFLFQQKGLQKGSYLAQLEAVAQTSGYVGKSAELAVERLKSLHENLLENVQDFDPVQNLTDAGVTLPSDVAETVRKELEVIRSPKSGKKKGTQTQTVTNPYEI